LQFLSNNFGKLYEHSAQHNAPRFAQATKQIDDASKVFNKQQEDLKKELQDYENKLNDFKVSVLLLRKTA
jgi:uncharacterized protein YlxW (UPF0749 family)